MLVMFNIKKDNETHPSPYPRPPQQVCGTRLLSGGALRLSAMPSRGGVSSADGNRRGGESVSGGIKASFNVKKGKQTLVFAGRGFVCGCK